MNANVRKLVMEMDAVPSLRTANSQMTDMYGSGRVEKYVAAGNSGSYPSSEARDHLSVSGSPDKLVDVSTGGNLKSVAKRMLKAAKPHLVEAAKAAQPVINAALAKKVKKLAGGKIHVMKKAKKWTDFAVSTAKKGIDLGVMGKAAFGGAKPKRFVKGSQEAKDHMAKIRAMRKK
jgi:hypothetical protein